MKKCITTLAASSLRRSDSATAFAGPVAASTNGYPTSILKSPTS